MYIYIHTHTHTYIYIYVCIYTYVYTCVCVYDFWIHVFHCSPFFTSLGFRWHIGGIRLRRYWNEAHVVSSLREFCKDSSVTNRSNPWCGYSQYQDSKFDDESPVDHISPSKSSLIFDERRICAAEATAQFGPQPRLPDSEPKARRARKWWISPTKNDGKIHHFEWENPLFQLGHFQ